MRIAYLMMVVLCVLSCKGYLPHNRNTIIFSSSTDFGLKMDDDYYDLCDSADKYASHWIFKDSLAYKWDSLRGARNECGKIRLMYLESK